MAGSLLTASLAACQFNDIPGFQQPRLPLDTTSPPPPQDIVAWLRDSSAAIRSLDFDDTDWSDLSALRTAIGDRRVVLLGEQSGGDGTTLRAKSRLVRFLHEAMGFDVLVFEGGVHDLRVAAERLATTSDPSAVVRAALPEPWRSSAELSPFVAWLGARARSDRPLRLAGVDPRFTGPAGALAGRGPGTALDGYLRAYDSPLLADSTWPALREALDELAAAGDANVRLPEARRRALDEGLQRLRVETNRLVNVAPEPEAAHWRSLVSALQVRELAAARLAAGQADTAAILRQAEMADLLVTLAQSVHRGRRLIVWTSSSAALRSALELTTPGGTPIPATTTGFGEQARAVLGDDQLYAIGFLAGEGSYGPFATGSRLRPLVRPTPESWEGLFLTAGRPLSFLHLRRTPTVDNVWLYDRRVSRALGYQQVRARWPFVFDGFVFTAEMTPVTVLP